MRWLLQLWVALLRAVWRQRAARPQRAIRNAAPWATCACCGVALDTVWRYGDASYCRACHGDISADSDSSAFSG